MISSFFIIFALTTVTTTLCKLNETTSFNQILNKLYDNLSAYKLKSNFSDSSISEPLFPLHIMNNMNNNQMYFLEELSQRCFSLLDNDRLQVWLMSVLSSCVIGVSSMLPLFLISFSNENFLLNKDSSSKKPLKYLLSFAVGGLLGDVFLHLLPEASNQIVKTGLTARSVQMYIGFWIICGIFSFALVEAIFSHTNSDKEVVTEINGHLVNGCHINGVVNNSNGRLSNGRITNGHIKHVENKGKRLEPLIER
jgi:hypothetical protein